MTQRTDPPAWNRSPSDNGLGERGYDANLATRRHFARLGVQCIRDAVNGVTKVNDLAAYVAWRRQGIREALSGDSDHTFTHRQYRHMLETGECVPLLNL